MQKKLLVSLLVSLALSVPAGYAVYLLTDSDFLSPGILRLMQALAVLLLVLAGQWLSVTFGGDMFRTCPLPASVWMKIVLATSMVLWLGELYRLLKKWVCRG